MSADIQTEVAANKEKQPKLERPGPHWRIWGCIEALRKNDVDSNPMMAEPYRSTTLQVVTILEDWGNSWAGNMAFASFLNKRTIHHEAEESIVALYYLREWMKQKNSDHQRLLAVDVCGGKGFFSMLLSYMVSEYWQVQDQDPSCVLDSIILLEKCTTSDIDWNHIHRANAREKAHPDIVIWSDTNLHEYDTLVSKLRALCLEKNLTLAMTGIHLCKMLSPSLVNLANGLGCPYLCLAPCCLPRIVLNASARKHKGAQVIPIYLHESHKQQLERLEHNRRKLIARNNHACFYCQKKRHWVKQCPDLKSLSKEEQAKIIDAAIQATPCWNCGTIGHFRADCPTPTAKITTRYPPTVSMDVTTIIESKTPYEDYCTLLANYIQLDGSTAQVCLPVSNSSNNNISQQPQVKKLKSSNNVQIIEAGLSGNQSGHDGNWNSRRKSVFLVATK